MEEILIKKKCSGCGIELQFEDKNKEGYVPEEKFVMQDNLLCQRCFKIKNYGENLVNNFSREDYLKEVNESVKKSDIILPIFDIIDFEGSFTEEILDYLRDYRSIILVNKIDLMPDFIHPAEISNWIKDRLAEEDIVPDDIAFISAKSKYGINGIIRKIKNIFPNKKVKATVLGVSNAGKSSVINLLLGNNRITTSKYSGTTLKSINNKIPNSEITIIDTPGLIPDGRISDLISVESGSKPIFSAYASKSVKFHVTREERVEDLLNGSFFEILQKDEKEKYFQNEFVTCEVEIEENEELAIAGLGWINVKRGPLKIQLEIPKQVKVIVRPSIFKNKK